mmetsp:Transcript_49973/g.142889  ORF Transcript_49973/g.142889 Transcript_49973/m.142889 type:complete len:680 (+) Transcript_49973:72-2111(+)
MGACASCHEDAASPEFSDGVPRIFDGERQRVKKRTSTATSLPGEGVGEMVTEQLYPMFLIEVPMFLGLSRLKPHQHLLAEGMLVEYRPEFAGRVAFVSHQWLGFNDPDPDGIQLQAMQAALSNMIAGKFEAVEADWMSKLTYGDETRVTRAELQASLPHMLLWVDYLAMPQPGAEPAPAGVERNVQDHRSLTSELAVNLGKAVSSIPSYLELTDLVLVLAPPARHANTGKICSFKSWRNRGWCRLEYAAATLATRDVRMLVVQGPEFRPDFMHSLDINFLRPGRGEFSCCAVNHDFGSGPVECDKPKIKKVMVTMLDAKVNHLSQTLRLFEMRYFVVMRNWLLAGLGDDEAQTCQPVGDSSSPAVSLLKKRLGWRSEAEEAAWVEEEGAPLLLWAAWADDTKAVAELLREPAGKAAVHSALLKTREELGVAKGATALHLAMQYASPETCQLLLDAGANPEAIESSHGNDPLMGACLLGRADNIEAWLQANPGWDLERRNKFGNTALIHACTFGTDKLATVQLLIRRGADVRARNDFGGTPLIDHAFNVDADNEVMKALLASPGKPNVNEPCSPPSVVFRTACTLMRLGTALGSTNKIIHFLGSVPGNTPLHDAALRGNVELCELLLAEGADPTVKNTVGTPLEYARWWMSGSTTGPAPGALVAIFDTFAAAPKSSPVAT